MLSSSRFVVAVHVLGMLARKGTLAPVCSTVLAESVDTNPVVIRRLMSKLESQGLVRSESGRGGGFLLAKPADQISLACIYHAVEDEQVFRTHGKAENAECETARAIMTALMPKLAQASKAMTESLRGVRLSDIMPASRPQAAVA
jgi:Rrf2 family protein